MNVGKEKLGLFMGCYYFSGGNGKNAQSVGGRNAKLVKRIVRFGRRSKLNMNLWQSFVEIKGW